MLLTLLPLLGQAGRPVLHLEATLASGSGIDATAFVDGVGLLHVATGLTVVAAVPNSSFETFTPLSNGSYGYNPTGGSWAFASFSGIASNGSAFGAPDGLSLTFLQATASGAGSFSPGSTASCPPLR